MNVILDIASQRQRNLIAQRLQRRFGYALRLREGWDRNIGHTLRENKPDLIIVSHRRALEVYRVLRQYDARLPLLLLETPLLGAELDDYTATLQTATQPGLVLAEAFKLLIAVGHSDPRQTHREEERGVEEKAPPILQGDLSVLNLHDLIQYLSQGKGSGRLDTTLEWGKGSLFFSSGELTHASIGPFVGFEALTIILGSSDRGTYFYVADAFADERSLQGTVSELLLRAAVTKDHETERNATQGTTPPDEFFEISL